MNQSKIGKFIQEQRKNKSLTQEQLAEKLGITKNAVSKWERGLCLMDMSLLKPLSEILDVSIVELINGEKIKEKELKQKSNEALEKTIKHNKLKEEKLKRVVILKTIFTVIIVLLVTFLTYKTIFINIYKNNNYDNEYIESFKEAYNNQNTMTIYKRTIPEEDYLVYEDIKIRNDFKNFVKETIGVDGGVWFYPQEIGKKEGILISKQMTFIDLFTHEDITYFDDLIDKKFKSADRKYFLLRKDINNDIDFINYIKEHYYEKKSIFDSEREIKEKYALNLFTDIVVAKPKSITILKGDYTGYIYNQGNIREVVILRNNQRYIFSFRGEKYTNDEYIKDILSTIEIK